MTDHEDFAAVLEEFGLSSEQMRRAALATRFIACDDPGVSFKPSPIEGCGMMAERPFCSGDLITAAMYGDEWTKQGRFTNHAADPNARAERRGRQLLFIARRLIKAGEEITVDYRQIRRVVESHQPEVHHV
jgi:hypothetical protein